MKTKADATREMVAKLEGLMSDLELLRHRAETFHHVAYRFQSGASGATLADVQSELNQLLALLSRMLD